MRRPLQVAAWFLALAAIVCVPRARSQENCTAPIPSKLRSGLDALKDKTGGYLLEEMAAATGRPLGQMVLDTGKRSFEIDDAYGAGDFIVVFDNRNRTLVYSLSSGQQIASYFGNQSAVSVPARLISIENQPGELDIYQIGKEQKTCDLTFSSPVALEKFSSEGQRLFVLTDNQTEFVFDSATLAKGNAPESAHYHRGGK